MKYFSYYAEPGNPENRAVTLAANNKIDYICDTIIKNGFDVEIISASATSDTLKYYRGKRVEIRKGLFLKTFPTVPWGNIIQKAVSLALTKLGLICELLKIKRGEKIIVYHSLGYMRVVDILHKIKKFHLVLEAEEIYADVIGDDRLKKTEIRFLRSADSYIFPTRLLNKMINIKNKPSVIIHGTYQVEPLRNCRLFNDCSDINSEKIIHCLYAGTFDPRKGGALAAV